MRETALNVGIQVRILEREVYNAMKADKYFRGIHKGSLTISEACCEEFQISIWQK